MFCLPKTAWPPTYSAYQEVAMKKLAKKFEDLWVAIAFAEEGIFEPAVVISEAQPRCSDSVRAHAA